jgi:hypothetical protein
MAINDQVKSSFALWQEYTEAYTDFVAQAAQQTLAQSFTLRERFDAVIADGVKKAQTLSAQEQELALGAAETVQAQARAASERLAKLFKTPPTG